MIDLATNSATVRTAPVYTLDHLEEAAYGVEYKARAEELGWAYHAMYNALPQGERSRLNLTVIEPLELIEKSYRRALAVQLAEAAGLKSSLVARLGEKHPEVLERFAQRVRRLAELTDPDAQLSVKKEVLESASTVDVFAFLRGYAAAYFDPSADRHAAAVALLDKRGPVDGRKVTALEQAYDALMQAAADSWPGHYPSREAMQAAVVRRAAFENQPNDALFRKRLDTFFSDTIARYQHIVGTTGLTDLSAEQRRQVDALFASGIDKTASAGVRSFEGLLSHGGVKKLAGGALELNARTIDALGYALVARPDGHRAVRVELPLDAYRITRSQVSKSALRYRYTTDGWKTSSEVGATLAQTERGPVARFDIDVSAEHGGAAQLEGQFRWKQGGSLQLVDGSTDFRGYTYAVPDPVDFERLAEGA
ncbi:MAG: hypothetical protein IPJ65_12015 [Archangiaceae bacterium]|nr:hypothetical protein [Archangiaceae bacterium]